MNNEIAEDGDLSELLNEVRILLPGAQLMSAFLITLPFLPKFGQVVQSEKWVFIATFVCSLSSLILFAAPAVQHRLMRPLLQRTAFKEVATRQILAGTLMLALSLVLSAEFVIAVVFGHTLGLTIASAIAILIILLWWYFPRKLKNRFSANG